MVEKFTLKPRSSPRRRLVNTSKARESVSVAVLLLRLLALPFYVRRQRRSPRSLCKEALGVDFSRSRYHSTIYITTGIYRCSIPGHRKKFCENFRNPRTSADKRFLDLYIFFSALLSFPLPGLLQVGLLPQN